MVSSQDEVWHLGDFARTAKIAAGILPVLNGRKHLIIGNNDPTEVLKLDWASVQHYAEITVDGHGNPMADGGILFNYEQCFECGTCYMVCNTEGALTWSYPEGGYGVVFRRS